MFTATTKAGGLIDLTPEHGVWSVMDRDGRVECDHYDVLTRVSDLDEFAEFCRDEYVVTRDLMREYRGDLDWYVEHEAWTEVGRSALAIAGLAMRSALIRETLILAEILGQSTASNTAPVIEPQTEAHVTKLGWFGRLRNRRSHA